MFVPYASYYFVINVGGLIMEGNQNTSEPLSGQNGFVNRGSMEVCDLQ